MLVFSTEPSGSYLNKFDPIKGIETEVFVALNVDH